MTEDLSWLAHDDGSDGPVPWTLTRFGARAVCVAKPNAHECSELLMIVGQVVVWREWCDEDGAHLDVEAI